MRGQSGSWYSSFRRQRRNTVHDFHIHLFSCIVFLRRHFIGRTPSAFESPRQAGTNGRPPEAVGCSRQSPSHCRWESAPLVLPGKADYNGSCMENKFCPTVPVLRHTAFHKADSRYTEAPSARTFPAFYKSVHRLP